MNVTWYYSEYTSFIAFARETELMLGGSSTPQSSRLETRTKSAAHADPTNVSFSENAATDELQSNQNVLTSLASFKL